jgi:hypothetical protein
MLLKNANSRRVSLQVLKVQSFEYAAAAYIFSATRRKPIPGGSFMNFIPEIHRSGQRSCSNSLLANLSGHPCLQRSQKKIHPHPLANG